ncbi:hypothetical protein [Haloarcula litorea]|uniref:hypothetical protein n=1 Tax=Haloarcula litorea TaxID=3032579 RepID=UPI0023E8D4C8|nr:hypothetical protein [Halomicroarcula sp. GDY20]
MRRATPVLVAALLVASTLAAVPAATMAQETTSPDTTSANASDAAVAPGAQFAGVVGVQGAELEGDVAGRAYGIRVANAATDDARAAIVDATLADVRARLDRLEQRRAALAEARANGSMSEGEYRARVARLHAEAQTADRLTARANETAGRLPAEALRANGVDPSTIRTLSRQADELTGPETAEIAREIAGPGMTGGELPAPAEDRSRGDGEGPTDGPPADDPELTATTETGDATATNGTAGGDDGETRGESGTAGDDAT